MRYILLVVYLLSCFSLSAQDFQKANDLFAKGNYSKAIAVYKTMDNLSEVYDDIAKAYNAIGNYGKALDYYKKAIEAKPDDLLLNHQYAKLLAKTKSYDKASEVFKSLMDIDSLNPNYSYELGLVLEKQGDSMSYKAFAKTLRLDSTHQKAIFKVARRLIVKREYDNAHQLIDKGLQHYATNTDLISLKAQAYYYQDYFTHAVVWFKKVLELGESSEFIHEKLSLSYARNSDYTEAIHHRKQALKYNPTDANAMFVIGSYYKNISNFEEAEAYISKSLLLMDVPLSEEYQKLGIVLNRQKKYDEAIKAFKKSLKEDPANAVSEFFILRTTDEYYKDVDTKIKMYKSYIRKNEKSPFKVYAKNRLEALKKEKFLEQN